MLEPGMNISRIKMVAAGQMAYSTFWRLVFDDQVRWRVPGPSRRRLRGGGGSDTAAAGGVLAEEAGPQTRQLFMQSTWKVKE